MSPGEAVALLGRSGLLAGLLDDDLAYAASRSGLVRLAAGERLFGPGERAERLWVLRAGEVGVYRASEGSHDDSSGREIARYVPGDALGDFDFAVSGSFDAEAKANVDSELLAFPEPGRDLPGIVRERPDAAARILLRSLSMISSRLRSTQRLISENSPWVRELRRQIYADPATGLRSRAFLDEEVPRALEVPTALVMAKPDRFKALNDEFGHAAGDQAMSALAGILGAAVERAGRGWAVRLRSNEVALVLPRCGRDEAVAEARALADAIGGIEVPLAAGSGFRFTTSAAVAVWPESGPDWRALVEGSYALLLAAWKAGGGRAYVMRPAGAPP